MYIWNKKILPLLASQLTRATFNTWLANTSQVGPFDGKTLIIGTPNAFAKDWLDNRLLATAQRAAEVITGTPVALEFVLQTGPDSAVAAGKNERAPEPGPGEFSIELVSFDPNQKGFVMASNYSTRFWQPYLNLHNTSLSPFFLWITLKSFAFEAQRGAWPSIQTLADICAKGQRYKLLGRAGRKGCDEITGALDILEQQRIVHVRRTGQGHLVDAHALGPGQPHQAHHAHQGNQHYYHKSLFHFCLLFR